MRPQAVIIAGGKGSRLGHLSENIPKPMVRIGDTPILEFQIKLLKRYGIKHITLTTGFLSEVIESYFGDGSRFGVKIDYFREEKPLGTAGGIKELAKRLNSDFIVLYGDVMINMDLSELLKFHKAKDAAATLVLHPNDHPYDSDLVEIDEDKRIVRFHPKPHRPDRYFRNLVNAGVYVLSPQIIGYIEEGISSDFGRDVFPKIVETENLYGYTTPEYIKDMGTPERLKQVTSDYLTGRTARFTLKNKRPAIFLDRDGVINYELNLLHKVADFALLPRAAQAVRMINASDFLAVVITNQPVVARGLCSIKQLEKIHNKMDTLLGAEGAKLDAVYYCPHHPDAGYPGENPKYKILCSCRKPEIGLIKKAQAELNIDLQRSFFIGDSARDILCGKNAGLTTVGVATGNGCKDADIAPDYFFKDLHEAVDFIISCDDYYFFQQTKHDNYANAI
ncbi:MAG: D,D-heptose 1,7-bisphosphate phosphatase [Planctomycetota bacterium]|nr:MAG: D,D-heptose 1,7-bisphosphate phosphatase [Planctomycetota bacterium]